MDDFDDFKKEILKTMLLIEETRKINDIPHHVMLEASAQYILNLFQEIEAPVENSDRFFDSWKREYQFSVGNK